ncbi:hypothetical protein BS47DRAFT_89250 [Hydnum rufescens UP504]|uniref:Zn(2)-C6 fungal-type domain-containing protein n=1 Tax=Hydnum rufescens UP504 TaxID=1448309 RepID=A0A9P6AR13_9AGAM|nr:hypothetical protein BS47DRAFT_89250 [Hydnum rufescens UP504]
MTPSSHKKTRQVSFANTTKLKPGALREGNPLGSRHEAQKERQERQELVSTPPKCTHCQKSGSRCVFQRGRRACNSCNARKVKCVQEAAEAKNTNERESSSEVQSPESSPSPRKEPPQPRFQRQSHSESPSPEQVGFRGRKRQPSPESYAEEPGLTKVDYRRLLLEAKEAGAIMKKAYQEWNLIQILLEELLEE